MPAPPSERLRAAGVAAAFADGVLTSALPLLTAAVTRNPFAVALVVAAQRLPGAVVAAGGRFGELPGDHRTVLAALTSVRAAVAGGLVLTELAGGPAWAVLLAAAAVLGHAQALDDARPAPPGGRAVVAHGAGIPLGAVLFSISAPLPFALDVPLLAVAGLVALAGRPRREPGPARPPSPPKGAARRALVANRRLMVATVVRAATAAGAAAALGVVVLLALDALDTGAVGFGVLLAALAVAVVLGTGLAPTLSRGGPGGGLVAGVLLLAGGGLAAGGVLDEPLAAGAALLAGMALSACAGVLVLAVAHGAAHDAAPAEGARGALRAHDVVVAGAGAAGAVAGGAAAAWWGLAAAYLGAGGLLGLAAVAVLIGKIR